MTTALRKYIHIVPVIDELGAHNVFLEVDGQRFCVTKYACDTKEDAEWMANQLCVALAKIVEDSKTALLVECADIARDEAERTGDGDGELYIAAKIEKRIRKLKASDNATLCPKCGLNTNSPFPCEHVTPPPPDEIVKDSKP